MKNFSKAVGIGLAVALVLLAVFAGAGAATFKQTDSSLSSDGTVIPGQSITSSVTFELNLANVIVADVIKVETDLESPWEATLIASTANSSNEMTFTNKYPSGSCLNLMNLGEKATITVTMTSTVPSSKRGLEITPLKVIVNASNSNESGTAKTDTVKVYNSGNLSGDIAAMEQNVSTLTNRIAIYKGYGLTTTVPESYLGEIKTCLTYATKAGSSDTTKASAIIKAGEHYTTAVNALNDVGLKGVKYYLDESAKMINSLKGMNRDVLNIQSLYESYNTSYTTYSNLSNADRDQTKIDELLQKSYELTGTATQELYNAEHPMAGFLKVLPYIIIGVVGAGVIAIVVFLIIRRRRNSWDELG